jgi:acyl-CoA thioesterase I
MKSICYCLFLISFLLLSSCQKMEVLIDVPAPAKNKNLQWLFLGDSYTIGQSVAEDERYPSHLKRMIEDSITKNKLKFTIENTIIAKTGWRTDNLINAIENSAVKDSNHFDLVALLIGVNNQYQGIAFNQYEIDFNALLNTALEKVNGDKNKIMVVSIPDYAFTPFGQNSNPSKISNELNQYNTKNKELSTKFGVTYIEITDISKKGLLEKTLVATDGLHPSGAQYTLWAERMVQKAMSLLD